MKPRGRFKWAALLSSGCFSYSLIYFMFINDVTVGFNDVLNCIKVVPILSDHWNSRGSRVLEVFRYLNVQSTMTSGLKISSTVIILTMPKTTENVAALLSKNRQESSIRFHKYWIRFNTAHQAVYTDFNTWDKMGNLPSFSCSYITTVCIVSVQKYRLY